MQTIVTPTLTLEPLLASHAEEMFELLSDRAIYRYLDYTAPVSIEYLRGVYRRWEARRSPDASEAWLNWAIRPRAQPLAGYVQATVTTDRSAYVAYILASKYWGRGSRGFRYRRCSTTLPQPTKSIDTWQLLKQRISVPFTYLSGLAFKRSRGTISLRNDRRRQSVCSCDP